MAVRGAGVNPLTLERPAAQAGQVRLGTRFIQKNQPGRIKARLLLAPESARPGDVRTVLLTGAECLFLYVNPIFPNATLMACKEQRSPVAARNSFKVRSLFLASKFRI
jgi:hypothetical protein